MTTTRSAPPAAPRVRIEREEDLYRFRNARNGASPLWCMGSTSLVRAGGELFASGLETIPGAKILHNTRWLLFHRAARGWELIRRDQHGRTREPCPLVGFADGRVFLSANPTLTPPGTYDGPAQPQLFEFAAAQPRAGARLWLPSWSEPVTFNEHSYRNFAADGERGELILFQNLGWDRAYWSFLDRTGQWSARGKLLWPWGADYARPQPIRLCYGNIQLRDRAVYVWGTSDIPEPRRAWKAERLRVTGRAWDYDFRRIFFSWTPDIRRAPFRPWQEIVSREATAGHAQNLDLWVAPDGLVHLLWRERSLDPRLRDKFFAGQRLTYSIGYALLRQGRVLLRRTIAEGGEGISGELPDWARFHVTPAGRLFAVVMVRGRDARRRRLAENRLVEIGRDGRVGACTTLRLKHPFQLFFTTTPRGGSPAADHLELLGQCFDSPGTMRYARLRVG